MRSASIGEERAVQTLREGATDYILKDRLWRLASAITRALDQRRDRQLRRRAQEALQRSAGFSMRERPLERLFSARRTMKRRLR